MHAHSESTRVHVHTQVRTQVHTPAPYRGPECPSWTLPSTWTHRSPQWVRASSGPLEAAPGHLTQRRLLWARWKQHRLGVPGCWGAPDGVLHSEVLCLLRRKSVPLADRDTPHIVTSRGRVPWWVWSALTGGQERSHSHTQAGGTKCLIPRGTRASGEGLALGPGEDRRGPEQRLPQSPSVPPGAES